MATLAELKTNVGIITNKAYMDAEIEYFVKQTISELHRMENFYQDRVQFVYSFPSSAMNQTVNKSTLEGQIGKKIRSFADTIWVGSDGKRNKELTVFREGEDIIDACGKYYADFWYIVGQDVKIVASEEFKEAEFRCYVWPDLTAPENDWLVTEYQDVVEMGAAAKVYGAAGMREERADALAIYTAGARTIISDKLESGQR